jgi:hypothetical protein
MPDQMREALEAAYEKHAAETPEVEAPVETPVVDAPVEAEAPKVEAAPVVDAEKPVADKPAEAPVTLKESPQGVAAAPVAPAKAPRSWSAEAKAAFAALPEPVKNDVLRREKEISQGLEQAAPARKHYESFQEVVKPFQPLFDAYGITDPMQPIRHLLSTRAALEIGTPEQKAQLVANMIHEFGIDVQMLDAGLVKKGPVKPFTPARPAPVQQRDPEVQMLLDHFKQARVAKAEAEVAKIETMPHFDEVREDIADVVEAFASQGKTISLENAYKRALAMNPSLEPVTAVPQITKSQAAAILASRNAASSISGTPRTGASPSPVDRRSQIAAAWEANRAS